MLNKVKQTYSLPETSSPEIFKEKPEETSNSRDSVTSCTTAATLESLQDDLWSMDIDDVVALNDNDDNVEEEEEEEESLSCSSNKNNNTLQGISGTWGMDICEEALNNHKDENNKPRRTPLGRSKSHDFDGTTTTTTTTTAQTTRPPRVRGRMPKRSVSFDKVKIRVFERVLVDNPPSCTSAGPSLGLGWNFEEKKDVAVDKFEGKGKKFPFITTKKNKQKKDLLLSVEKRGKIAKKLGFTSEEIKENTMKVDRVLRQRKRTVDAYMEEQYDAMFIMQMEHRARALSSGRS